MAVVELAPEPEVVNEEQETTHEAPSVFAVTNRHIIGRVDVSPPGPDGSRVMRLHSANGATVIEANLAAEACEFISTRLTEVEIIEEAEVVDDGATTD